MGKKSGRNGGGAAEAEATALVLKVPMHCRCDGCSDKIRAGVKDLTLHYGIQSLDQSALQSKGELRVVLAAGDDPDRLRRRLRKTTGKNVDLVLLPSKQQQQQQQQAAIVDRELLEAMLLRSAQAQAQYGGQVVPPGYAYAAAQAYHPPWGVVPMQQQQPQGAEPYDSSSYSYYPPAAYHGYPQQQQGGYGGY